MDLAERNLRSGVCWLVQQLSQACTNYRSTWKSRTRKPHTQQHAPESLIVNSKHQTAPYSTARIRKLHIKATQECLHGSHDWSHDCEKFWSSFGISYGPRRFRYLANSAHNYYVFLSEGHSIYQVYRLGSAKSWGHSNYWAFLLNLIIIAISEPNAMVVLIPLKIYDLDSFCWCLPERANNHPHSDGDVQAYTSTEQHWFGDSRKCSSIGE